MICSRCTKEDFEAIDSLCRCCRLRVHTVIRYPWTPEMDALLTKAWRTAKDKKVLSARKAELARRYGYPACIIQNRATRLGLRTFSNKPWSADDLEFLAEYAGDLSIARIAKRLGRSYTAVLNKMGQHGLSGARTDSFTPAQLAGLFGVRGPRVTEWLARGYLCVVDGQIPYASVERFAWDHMQEYRFAHCDDWWIKTILNPKLGQVDLRGLRQKAA